MDASNNTILLRRFDMKTFEMGTIEHYQEYLKSREPFKDTETPLTHLEFLESLFCDE